MNAPWTPATDAVASDTRDFRFGPFRFSPARQTLLEGDRPLHIGSRALDILATLVARAGETVSKEELVAAAWPRTFVDETNLRVQIASLRRALGDEKSGARYIATIAGRGYRFVAEIASGRDDGLNRADARSVEFPGLPPRTAPIFGRSDAIRAVAEHLQGNRLATIVGPAGVGKSTVAAAVVRECGTIASDVSLIDLATIADARDVAPAIAACRGSLILLDNCDHIIDTVAPLVEEILARSPGVRILATSREPLRIEDERVFRLPPLALPPAGVIDADGAMHFPAIQLFVNRAGTSLMNYALSDRDAATVANICARLDGLPLAIELAAGCAPALGLANLKGAIDQRFSLLAGGRRTASPRHRTLAAALDWSCDLLPDAERLALCRLANLPGNFDLKTAIAFAASDDHDLVAIVASLVAKSLVIADTDGPEVVYRLLGTTRAYLRDRLARQGEHAVLHQWRADPRTVVANDDARYLHADTIDRLAFPGELARELIAAAARHRDL